MRDPISRIPCTLNPARILAEHKVSDEGGRRKGGGPAWCEEREIWKGKLLLRAVKRSDGGRGYRVLGEHLFFRFEGFFIFETSGFLAFGF